MGVEYDNPFENSRILKRDYSLGVLTGIKNRNSNLRKKKGTNTAYRMSQQYSRILSHTTKSAKYDSLNIPSLK